MNAALCIEGAARQHSSQLQALSYLEHSRRHRNRQRAIAVLSVLAGLAITALILSEVL